MALPAKHGEAASTIELSNHAQCAVCKLCRVYGYNPPYSRMCRIAHDTALKLYRVFAKTINWEDIAEACTLGFQAA